MLSQTLKNLRKQAQMSQEQLAEKLCVSRQAVTKWETGAGVPDIENLRALSALFHVSIDELLANSRPTSSPEFLFDSTTEYDIDCEKSYDIAFAGAKRVVLLGCEGEKLRVRLASDQLPELARVCKVKIDDVKRRLDVEIRRFGDLTETKAKEALTIFLSFPQGLTKSIELAGSLDTLEVRQLAAETVEFSGKAANVLLADVSSQVELNSNEDLKIRLTGLAGRLDVNQISATSRLLVPENWPFTAHTRGLANTILYEKDGRPADDFSCHETDEAPCENMVELNGMKSELIIAASAAPLDEV